MSTPGWDFFGVILMEYPIRTEGSYTVVALSGEVDLRYSPQVRKQILSCLEESHPLLIDLTGVEYIDSSGVASLVEGFQLARKKGLEFGLLGVSSSVMQLFRLARLDKIFPIYESAIGR